MSYQDPCGADDASPITPLLQSTRQHDSALSTRKAKPAIQLEHRSAEEKALVRRLDMFLLTFGCISQVIK
ncbi:hypothetical protein KCU83_g420, partial [Aureobasidium melanogenum]